MFDRALRTLAHVPRWAILRVNRRQSVAEHSYYVAVYALEIAEAVNWKGDFGRLASLALMHDAEEVVTSDIPSPVKKNMVDHSSGWVHEKMRERMHPSSVYWRYAANDEEKAILKLADLVEGALYLADEKSQGNGNTEPMYNYIAELLRYHWHKVFMPMFKLDNGHLAAGGRLWTDIQEAISNAARGHDPVVA